MVSFRRNQGQIEYHQTLQRITQLEHEIGILEGLGQGAAAVGSTLDRSLTNLRANLATQGLSTKREELAELKARADAMVARDPGVAKPLPPPKPAAPPRDMRRPAIGAAILLLVVGLVFAGVKLFGPKPHALVTYLLAPTIEQRVSTPGNLFYTSPSINVDYDGGTVTISGDPVPTGPFAIDDEIVLDVTHPDNSTQSWEHTFNDNCVKNENLDPQDLTSLFQKGKNVVKITLHDVCGGAAGTSGPVFLAIH